MVFSVKLSICVVSSAESSPILPILIIDISRAHIVGALSRAWSIPRGVRSYVDRQKIMVSQAIENADVQQLHVMALWIILVLPWLVKTSGGCQSVLHLDRQIGSYLNGVK